MSTEAPARALPPTFANFEPPAAKQAIQRVRYTHDAMIDMIVQDPWVSQGELARNFGFTEGWVSQVIASDAFQARLAQRKDVLIDPVIRASIDENFKSLIKRSHEILMRKLDQPMGLISDELALKALEISAKAAGYGARNTGINLQQNFVVQVPAKSATSGDWVKEHGAGGKTVTSSPSAKPAEIVDAEVLVASGSAAPATLGVFASTLLLEELKRS